jgi:diguanylate cyclase (GGDEF)-like protein
MDVVTVEDFDREIGRSFLRFRFAAKIERQFVEDYAKSRVGMAPLWAAIGLAMYLFMLVDDYNLTPDVFQPLLIARICLFSPVAILGTWAVMHWRKAILYDLLALWVGVVGSLLPMSIVTFSHSDRLFIYQSGNVGAFMFFVIVLRPRFQFTLIGLVLMAAIHLATTALTGAFDDLTYSSILSFVAMVTVFLAAGSYFLEQVDRMNFLNRQRGSLLHAELERQSERDELTGLFNRRSLAHISQGIWRNPDRNQPVSVIMLDIDRFKLFNDKHGHVEGDDCIRAVSRSIADELGSDGTVFRFGGEEMLALLPDTGLLKAVAKAERIRAAIEALQIRHAGIGDSHVVTASLGVASGQLATVTLSELVRAADGALYDAKHRGRNAVAIAESDVTPADGETAESRTA